MAYDLGMASSSFFSSYCLRPQWKYEYGVFITFRGEDTRDNIVSHLLAALGRESVSTFSDEGLERGDEILPALLSAIEASQISIVIFSEKYASSKWCLKELVKILYCKKMNGQIVIPVFYHVNPSDVRNQTGGFGAAFVEHENNFKVTPKEVQKWRDALKEASNLSGLDSMKIKSEAKLVEAIVEIVLMRLKVKAVSMVDKQALLLDMVCDKLDSTIITPWNNTDPTQLQFRLQVVQYLLHCYRFNQHRFDQAVRKIDGELVHFMYSFHNLVSSHHNGEWRAISESLTLQPPSLVPFVDSPFFSLAPSPSTNKDSYGLSVCHNAQSLPLATSSHTFSFGESSADNKPCLNLSTHSCITVMKTVYKCVITDKRTKYKAMIIISGFEGIHSISFDPRSYILTVIGDADPVSVAQKLRKKVCYTEIISVGTKPKLELENWVDHNKEEPKKAEKEKKD